MSAMTPEDRDAIRARHSPTYTDSDESTLCACRAPWPCDAAALLDALDEALDTVEDLVIQHCYAESDGSYDTSALSTNRDAFDLLVRAGRAEYVGEQVGRRAFIRLTEATP